MLQLMPPDLPDLRPWTLWAKWSSKEKGTWHPLLFHLIDVAMCAEAMWDHVLSPAVRQRLADGMELSVDDARAWVIFLAGLHDIGKACPGFQLQLGLDHIEARLRSAGLKVQPCDWVPHGTVSAQALRNVLPARYGVSHAVASMLATTLGGHHGFFPSPADIANLPLGSLGQRSWEAARLRYISWLGDLLDIAAHRPPQACTHVTAILLGGFISVVDWLGSDESIFQHGVDAPESEPSDTPPTYLVRSRHQALKALGQRGWLGWTPTSERLSFDELFPDKTPRPLQCAVEHLAARLSTPALVIIEAPMGEGKTEAAMLLADTWTATGGQRGMYFALPTQATSNQMFGRARDFLARRYPRDVVNLQLLHGHAALSDIVRDLQAPARAVLPQLSGIYDVENPHKQDGCVMAAEWFASGKRAVLAPFGVGTVDQALLAALQVKHFFVRLYGLGSKTIIIDEVHAYDTYMTSLIERLLEWLAALGAPVILLSATLPSTRRAALLHAYAKGARWTRDAPGSITSAAYPRISWASRSESGELHTPADSSRERELALEWRDLSVPRTPEDVFPLADVLDRLLADGGCCAVICNTVSRAQAVYDALKQRFPGVADDGYSLVDLFHARFLFKDRGQRERRSLQRFGVTGPRPHKAILVATQVIEQSLDLDFDLLVTDLAPIDLILQRAGRLHRHERTRPPRLHAPRLIIARPVALRDGNVPVFEAGSQAVYAPHVLLKTWLALGDQPTVRLPQDISPLIERVYEDDQEPSDAAADLRTYWLATREALRKSQESEAREAENRYIKRPWADVDLSELAFHPREEDAPELHPKLQALTRLTEATVQAVCLAGNPEAPRIGPDGPTVSLETKPTFQQTLALLSRSVQISNPFVVYALLASPPPRGWQESPLLRRARAVFFDGNGTAMVGGTRMRLDPELGIVIETRRQRSAGQ
jgi:CRISPR-associated endonuclease/helicase Cas3